MLSQKPEETGRIAAHAAPTAQNSAGDDSDAAVQALMEVIQASPEFQMANDFSEYLTSPLDDSPWDDFLTTPAIGTADMASDLLTSPAIVDGDDFNDFGDLPLFGDGLSMRGPVDTLKASDVARAAPGLPAPALNFDDMYRMPSPSTPALDPTSLDPSPRLRPVATPTAPATGVGRRRKEPTGTRKNVTPESLVPFDAPIQSRKYVTPSATSRKEIPAVFAKKRGRSQAFGDDEDGEIDLAPEDVDAIEAKRRQNTLAARRSRKRKLEYQRELEQGVELEREEKEMWKSKAVTYAALLQSHGIELPPGL